MLSKMREGRAYPVASVVVFTLALISLVSCATAQTGLCVVLPNSYYLQPDKDLQTVLVRHNGRRVMKGHVAAYAVSGFIVAGAQGDYHSPRYYTNAVPYTGGPKTRYFILDTTTGKVETDLTEDAWRKRLHELGVRPDFEIYPLLPWQP